MLNTDYCYAQSQCLTKGVANRDFVLSAIAQVKIFIPPIELQRQYKSFVEQTNKSKYAIDQFIKSLHAAKDATA
jgi:type I restriction enzyme S subunit